MRQVAKTRETGETKISISLNLDGNSQYKINTGLNFLNHMLNEFSLHSGFDLDIEAISKDFNSHHLVEDIGITLGEVFKEAIFDKRGIARYSNIILPMDETLVMSAVDISGRAYLNLDVDIAEEKTSDFETVLLYHFWDSFVKKAEITLHIKVLYGKDPHHIIEAIFKSVARVLKEAVKIDETKNNTIPSTKGIL